MLKRLYVEDHGQDVIEYALLSAAIGIAGILVWPLITDAMGTAYETLDERTQDIWEVPDPGAGL
jgi:Flp pilus assembly pilin Flp